MGIKWPKVSIKFEEDPTYAIGKISPWFVIGFALRIFWPFLAILGEFTLVNDIGSKYVNVLNLVSVLTLGVVMLWYGAFMKRARKLFSTTKRRQNMRLIAAICIAVGVLFIALANINLSLRLFALPIAGVLTGFGSAVLMMSYAVSAGVCDVASIALSAAFSFAIAICLFALIVLTCKDNPLVCCIIAIVIPFCEWFCLKACSAEFVDKLEFRAMTVPVRTVPFALHIAIPCFLLGIVMSICRLAVMRLSANGGDSIVATIVISALLSGLLIALAVLFQRRVHNFMTRVLVPVIAVMLAVSILFELNSTENYLFVFTCSYILIGCSVWVILGNTTQQYRISTFTVYGFGYGMLLLGETLTFSLDCAGVINIGVSPEFFAIAVILLFLMATSTALLPTHEELLKTLKMHKMPEVDFGDEHPATFINENESMQNGAGAYGYDGEHPASIAAEFNGEHPVENMRANDGMQSVPINESMQSVAYEDEFAQSATGAGTGVQDAAGAAAQGAQAVQKVQGVGAQGAGAQGAGAQAAQSVQGVVGTGAGAQSGVKVENQSGTQSKKIDIDALHDLDKQAIQSDKRIKEETEIEDRPNEIKRKCAVIADTYLLSRREAEVFYLLACGRNAASIQKILYIAPGTANTHMRHIYKKINVHSQQELLDLLDSVELDN